MQKLIMATLTTLALATLGCAALGPPKKVATSGDYTLTVRDNDKDSKPCARGSSQHPAEVGIGTLATGLRKLDLKALEPTTADIHFAFQQLKTRQAVCIAQGGTMIAGLTFNTGALQLWRVTNGRPVLIDQVTVTPATPPTPTATPSQPAPTDPAPAATPPGADDLAP